MNRLCLPLVPALRTACTGLTALALAWLSAADTASALEGGDPVWDPQGKVIWAPDEQTTGTRDAAGKLTLNRGLYVIGDSISLFTAAGPTTRPAGGVPYVWNAAATLGANANVRAASGSTIRAHRFSTNWGSNNKSSFDDAAASDASTVFVELGTNDLSCLHKAIANDPRYATTCLATARYEDNDPLYANWAFGEKLQIVWEAQYAIDTLLAAGKCVIWAGPREVGIYGIAAADAAWFNDWLQSYAATKGGKLVYADFDAYARNQPDIAADFAEEQAPDVHLQSAASGRAIADFAMFYAHYGCGMPLHQ